MFTRLAGLFRPQKSKRINHIDMKFVWGKCAGTVQITDVMLQEGWYVTAHLSNTKELLLKMRDGETIRPPRFFNAVIRGNKTIVLPNLNETTTGLDYIIYTYGNVSELKLSHYPHARQTIIKDALINKDVYKFQASTRHISKNDVLTHNIQGLFHHIAGGDTRFNIDSVDEEEIRPYPKLRLLLGFQEMKGNKKI